MTKKPIFEKAPGFDWIVAYLGEDDDGREVLRLMSVFGQLTAEQALAEARFSFGAFGAADSQIAIVGVERADLDRIKRHPQPESER
jgi:hypothetical protein